jgi:glucosamine--fructose-6-phosphate aminotransferase (isomerizing)
MTAAELRDVGRIVLTGCGTALHAGMAGEYLIERLANIPTEVEFASEFRHRNTPMTPETLVFAISQSGETADTLGALRESRRKGFRTLGICNNVASTIARESDGGVYMHAGPEIGVAATKSFTSQLVILTLIGLLFGRMRNLSTSEGSRIIEALEALPEQMETVLKLSDEIKTIAKKYSGVKMQDIEDLKLHRLEFHHGKAILGEFTNVWHEDHSQVKPEDFFGGIIEG